MQYYFIKEEDKEIGPFAIRQLKCKSIKKETPIWFAGLQEWTTAGQVCELRELFVPKESSRSFVKSKLNKIRDHKFFKRQIKKVPYQLYFNEGRKKSLLISLILISASRFAG